MKILRRSLAHRCLAALLACAVVATGCHQPQPAISAQTSLDTSVGEGKVRFIQYKGPGGSQAVMICLDSRGDASFNEGSLAAGPDNIFREKGSESWRNGRRWEWQVETTDGSSIKVSLDGKAYDASKGNLFLVTTKGGKSEMEQHDRDLSAVQPDWKSVKTFARTDAVVSKFLGVKAD